MNELTKFLVESVIGTEFDEYKEATALFGGGFKPPTKGHLDVIVNGIKQNPEINKLKIIVGGGERNGITQDQAAEIWNFYNDINLIPVSDVEIIKASPFNYYKEYLRKNPDDKTFVFIGSREGDDKDQMDVKQRSEFVKKYSNNVIPVEVSTVGGVSGTEARKLFKTDLDGFRQMLPANLIDSDFKQIVNILNGKSTNNTQELASTKTEPLSPVKEAIIGDKIECDNCGWSWEIVDGGNDLFICHKCWHDNTPTLNENEMEDFAEGRGKGAGTIADNAKEKGGNSMLTYHHFKVKAPYYKKATDGKFNKDEFTEDYKGFLEELYEKTKDGMNIDPVAFQELMGKIEVLGELLVENKEVINEQEENSSNKVPEAALILPRGKKVVLQAEEQDYKRGLIVELSNEGGYKINYWYGDDVKIYPAEVEIDGESIKDDANEVYIKFHPELNENDPKKGKGKKPKGSGRRLYTDEDPKDTIGIKFSTKQDIVDTLNKTSFKAKSHARQSQIINLIHQRVRAAYGRAKDPAVKKRLKTGLDYITDKKEASKKKTQRLKDQKENIDPKSQAKHKGKSAPFGSAYKPVNEQETIHKVIAKGVVFEPKNLTINVGDTVKWINKQGVHNVNGNKSHKRNQNNPKSFGNKVGSGWTYEFTFNKPGLYKYHCDPHLSADMVGTIKVKENINENATYSSKIDYKQQIKDLTKHMIKKGMNILPLPRVIFKHGDQENASQFLGKTAYYSPSDMTVVLYTEGRHPKDIVRSFAHEMVHHIQNLEDRLGGINTTNTMEDDNLNDIEREAYTKGNMTFRNWTDNKDGEEVTSLSEKKKGFDDKLGEDPFGLNQYARELVNETFKKSITIDMGPIIKALEFEMPTGQETDENAVAIIDAAPQGKVPHPVFLDFYAKFDKYFGEENDSRMLDNLGLEYLLSNVLNLPNEDIQTVINHYNITDQDNVEWFEQHDNELERDEEHNIPGFNDTDDDYKSVVNYRKQQLAKSLEEQERVRIFNPNCGCDKT